MPFYNLDLYPNDGCLRLNTNGAAEVSGNLRVGGTKVYQLMVTGAPTYVSVNTFSLAPNVPCFPVGTNPYPVNLSNPDTSLKFGPRTQFISVHAILSGTGNGTVSLVPVDQH